MISVDMVIASVVISVVFLISYFFPLIIVIAVYRELNDPEAEREVFKFLKLLIKKGIIDNLNAEIFCEQFSKDILKRKSPILIRFNSGDVTVSKKKLRGALPGIALPYFSRADFFEKKFSINGTKYWVNSCGWSKKRVQILKEVPERIINNPFWEKLKQINLKYRFICFEDKNLTVEHGDEVIFYKNTDSSVCGEREFIRLKITEHYESFVNLIKCAEENRKLFVQYEEEVNAQFMQYHQTGHEYEFVLFQKEKISPLRSPKIVLKLREIALKKRVSLKKIFFEEEGEGEKEEYKDIRESEIRYEFEEWFPIFEEVRRIKEIHI